MRSSVLIFSIMAVFVAGCSTGGGVNSESASNGAVPTANTGEKTENIPYPTVERIPLDQAKRDFDSGDAVFIDTHSPSAYEKEHIAGAINVPVPAFEAKLDTIPKGKKIIAYCS